MYIYTDKYDSVVRSSGPCMQEWNIIVGAEIVEKNVICHNVLFLLCFLQRVSIACYAERCTSYSKSVRPSVCPSVRPAHTGTVKTTPATIMQSSL